jgi:hypothetical protein
MRPCFLHFILKLIKVAEQQTSIAGTKNRAFVTSRMPHFVRLFRTAISVAFRRFLGDVRREFMQRVSAALHGTLGSYLCDTLQGGRADAPACLPVPRAWVFFLLSSFC